MGARPGLRRLAVVTLVAVALAGCATQSTSPDAPVNSPRIQPALVNPAWKGCWAVRPFQTTFEPNSVPGAGAVPQDFRPVSAVECVEDRRHSADGSIVSMAVERRSSGVAGLMAAFALPSLHQAGVTCAGVGWEPPWLFLLDREGRWISPQIPTDACEQPRKELSAAYRSTRFTDTRTRLIRVEEPAAAIKAGCSGHETDWPWFVTLERRKKAGTLTTDPLDGRRSRLCVYSVAGQEEGPTRPPGQFVAGRRLSRPDRSAIVRAMIGTAPADPCRRPADAFAALHRIDNRGTSVYVELTGCRRVVVVRGENDYLLSRASPGLLALLGASVGVSLDLVTHAPSEHSVVRGRQARPAEDDGQMSVPSGPSRSSGQEPGYWDRPENQPGHPEFWSPGLSGSRMPRGVLTQTARGSLISFVITAAAGVMYVVTLFLDLPPDWSNGRTYFRITAPALFALLALRYLRSWRLLRRRAAHTPANADSA